jgi:hypothetical protein
MGECGYFILCAIAVESVLAAAMSYNYSYSLMVADNFNCQLAAEGGIAN